MRPRANTSHRQALLWLSGLFVVGALGRVAGRWGIDDALISLPLMASRPLLELWRPGIESDPRGPGEVHFEAEQAMLRTLKQRDDLQTLPSAGAAGTGEGLLCEVIERQGRGAAGLPDALLVQPPAALAAPTGAPALCGDVLLGFVAEPTPTGNAWRVELLHHRQKPRWRTPARRLLAHARPLGPAQPNLDLRFVLEPADLADPFPLHVLYPDRPHTRTWGADREYVATTLAQDSVPAGLRLGRVRSQGYRDTEFVLDWFLEPELDPRVVSTVVVLGGNPASAVARQREDSLADRAQRVPVMVLGSVGRASRVFLVDGRGTAPGSAITDGARLVGMVVKVLGNTAIVRRFGHPGELWPVLFTPGDTGQPSRLLLRSRGWIESRCVFDLVFCDRTPPHQQEGVALTGAVSRHCPRGLLLGRLRFVADRVEIEAPTPTRLPRELHALVGPEVP